MKTHKLKTWPEHFQEVKKLNKTFEVRKNDRDFQEGDVLVLQEWDPESEDYTGVEKFFSVGKILHGNQFGIKEDYVVISLKKYYIFPEYSDKSICIDCVYCMSHTADHDYVKIINSKGESLCFNDVTGSRCSITEVNMKDVKQCTGFELKKRK